MSTQVGINAIDKRVHSNDNDLIQSVGTPRTFQNVSITDMLSEGPIEGLTEGGSSIFLNGDPLFAEGEAPFIESGTSITASGSAGSNTITTNAPTSQTKGAADLFIGVSKVVETTVEITSLNEVEATQFATTSGIQANLTAASSVFTADMVHNPSVYGNINLANLEHGDAVAFLTLNDGSIITGYLSAHTNGTQVQFRSNYTSNVQNFLESADTASGNSHKLTLDIYYKVSSISGNTITLTSNLSSTFASKKIIFQSLRELADPKSSKYPGSKYQFRVGNQIQPLMSGINDSGSTSALLTLPAGNLTKNTPKTITAANLTGAQKSEADSVKFIITYTSGLYFYSEESGNEYSCGAGYRVEVGITRTGGSMVFESLGGNIGPNERANGVGTATESIIGHSTLKKSAVAFEFEVDLTPYQPFTDFAIRITRLTNHGSVDDGVDYQRGVEPIYSGKNSLQTKEPKYKMVGAAVVSSATAIFKEKLSFPYTALANVGFSSKQFGNVPKRTYDVKGLKIQVPSNYVTRDENVSETTNPGQVATYKRNTASGVIETTNQAWDGNFRAEKVYCNNPAWVFYDILVNNRYGLGKHISALDIDKFSLYKIGRYCDELVNDGKGGKEPRFTANLYLQKATDAYKVLKDMATIFRGMLYWLDGLIVPVIDEEKEPVYNFSKSNVVGGQFVYEGTGSKTRANQYVVTWNNPDSQYKLEPLIVEDRLNIIKTGKIIQEKAVAFGCTSEGQAIRYGKWKLWTAINQTEIVSFETGINASFLTPGDIINVSDSDDFNIPFSGRVKEYTESGGNFLTLDRDIDAFLPAADYSYELSVIIPKNVAILNQDSATVGGASLSRGDVVSQARVTSGGSQTTLVVAGNESTTQLNISNALDDSNNSINLILNTSTIVQKKSLTGSTTVNGVSVQVPAAAVDGRTKVKLTEAFDEDNVAHLSEAIWAITQIASSGVETASSPKQYKILGIVQDAEAGTFSVSAVEHYNAKFDSIEQDFNLAIVDPVFPPEPDTSPPPPTKLRILRVPIRHKAGEEVRVEWDEPAGYDFIQGFEITHNFNEEFLFTQTFAPAGVLKRTFTGIPDGTFQVQVRTVSKFNKKSKPVIQHIKIVDIFGGGERFRGILKGGTTSSALDMNRTAGEVFFKKDSYRISPPNSQLSSILDTGTLSVKANNSSNSSSLTQSVTALSNANWPGYKNESDARSGQLFYDYSNADHGSNDPIRLIAWKRDEDLDIDYWFDADKYLANANNVWTNLSGTVAISANDNKVTGSGTSFTSLDVTRVLKFSSTKAAKIAFIESDTVLYLDRTFDAAVSAGTTAAVDELGIDYAEDFLIAEVTFKSGLNYTLKPYLLVNELLADNSRGVIATCNVSTLSYAQDGTIKTDFDNITLKVQTVGFASPKIKVNGAGFDQTDQTAQTSFSAISSEPHSVTLHSAANDGANPIPFTSGGTAGLPLVFTVTIEEEKDSTLTATDTITITKSQETASGDGKKSANGYLYYNTQQASAPSAPSSSGVAYAWATGLMSGGVIGTGATNWNQIAPTATGGQSSSKMWYVYYNVEQSDNDVQNDNATSAVTFGTVVYAATNFTGLVRFNGTNAVEDGSGNGLSFGSTGTTTIDGGRITTGTISANRISLTGKNVGDLTNDAGYITNSALSPYITTSAANGAFAALSSFNALSTTVAGKQDASTAINTSTTDSTNLANFTALVNEKGIGFKSDLVEDLKDEINADVAAGDQGTLLGNFASALTSTGLILESNFYEANGTTINSTFRGQLTTAGLALSASVPFATATTDITAGRIVLESNNLSLEQGTGSPTTTNSIVLEATNNQNRIVIYDNSAARVIIGKL